MIYVETSVLAVFTIAKGKEPERYEDVARLMKLIEQGEIEALTSFYALNELYMLAFHNAENAVKGLYEGSAVIQEVLSTGLLLAPMLSRHQRLVLRPRFKAITDSSDIPHAIVAYLWGCQAFITYDSHFQVVESLLNIQTPDEFIREHLT